LIVHYSRSTASPPRHQAYLSFGKHSWNYRHRMKRRLIYEYQFYEFDNEKVDLWVSDVWSWPKCHKLVLLSLGLRQQLYWKFIPYHV
jgi:hypothetical protein